METSSVGHVAHPPLRTGKVTICYAMETPLVTRLKHTILLLYEHRNAVLIVNAKYYDS